ncbi:MAG: hypothetical protein JXX14_11880 [Deltaproteobacteria bacterium]|nr:hypothetical protein [Deltaproteobacteria bacterium]
MHSANLKIRWLTACFCAGLTVFLVTGCQNDSKGGSSDIEGDVAGECSDDADNDRDGLFDCDDPDCMGSQACGYNPNGTDSSGDTGTGSQDTGTGTGSQDTGTGTGSQDTGTGTGSQDTGTGTGSQDTGTGTGSQDTGTSAGAPSDTILYNGETVAYAAGEAWDGTSSISESTASPNSAPNHIRASIVAQDDWGAVVYYFDSGATQDWTEATRISLQIKGNAGVNVALALVCVDGSEYAFGSSEVLQLSASYQHIEIDVSALSGNVDISQVAGVILYTSSGEVVVDIDDISVAFGGETVDTGTGEGTDTGIDTGTGEGVDSDTGSGTDDIQDSETGTGTGQLAEVHYFGRFDMSNPNSPACGWTNCGAGVRFQGDALDVELSGAGGISFQVVLDGELHDVITTAGSEWSQSATPRKYRVVDGASSG